MRAWLCGKALFPWRRAFLERFCRVVLPGAAQGFPAPNELKTIDSVERYVAELHPLIRLGMMGLFDFINFLAIFLGYLRPMMWLSDDPSRRYLRRLEQSRLYLIRSLFVTAKALVMLVYYGHPTVERKTLYQDDCLVPSDSEPVP